MKDDRTWWRREYEDTLDIIVHISRIQMPGDILDNSEKDDMGNIDESDFMREQLWAESEGLA